MLLCSYAYNINTGAQAQTLTTRHGLNAPTATVNTTSVQTINAHSVAKNNIPHDNFCARKPATLRNTN